MASRIELIEGSPIAEKTIAQVQSRVPANASVMIVLDSNHSHDRVFAELERYASGDTKAVSCGCRHDPEFYPKRTDSHLIIRNVPPWQRFCSAMPCSGMRSSSSPGPVAI
jgi:hypothetical protein